ncbi:putative bifunctional diguanylate cyclase/phosphodiesterase [Gellertiella hungarica]|uniref:Diguanylate cyclase (GGDEF)-like protein n=1 Tax=Gellertiella hungarica TaxID=1572859 RepID=A0A7W6J407_9HYPH|nr:bifunctional diguanylate cyclase/phosphodiesterase [Gellertiella hungarica]MBB4063531.1 diguanylate cyclase (GGDEF)-like protein [Gellertiella hungarica]
MTLKAFLPGRPAGYALGCSALAMTVPALTYGSGIFGESAPAACAQAPMLALGVVAAAAGGLGFALGKTREHLQHALRQMEAREQALVHEARHDSLTGLRNRLALKSDVAAILASSLLPRQALLLLDLDRFKFVNDTLGHDAGDELLQNLTRRLQSLVTPADGLYRLGGDEFVILLDDPDSLGSVEAFCRRLEQAIEEPHDLAKGRVATGVSIGISFLRTTDADLSAALKRADLALYKAKEVPGSAHVFYNDALAEQSTLRVELERDLSRALADGEFYLEYQPIVGVETGAVRSFEALLRWDHPDRGVLPPPLFVPLAERTGLIVPLGRWVMRQACLEAAKWPSPTGVAVNVAGDQFKDRTFVSHVLSCLREARLAPGRLTIEITESIFTIDIEALSESLAELRSYGVRIALDDFGTGFSSINNLKSFPLDQLKIDRSFAREMLADSRDAELVELIRRLGDTFRVSTTIEGIETEGQLEFIRALGVAEAQGFLISRPIPADQVGEFCQQWRSAHGETGEPVRAESASG